MKVLSSGFPRNRTIIKAEDVMSLKKGLGYSRHRICKVWTFKKIDSVREKCVLLTGSYSVKISSLTRNSEATLASEL